MNISTLAKILGVSIAELRETGTKNNIYGFSGRNTRIPYNSAREVTQLLRPEKLAKLENDDRIYLPASLTVSEFAEAIGKAPGLVVKTLVLNGVMATLNEKIDYDTANLIAAELGVEVLPEEGSEIISSDNNQSNLTAQDYTKAVRVEGVGRSVNRPPIVTVMGHVDHGKTTLLDTIRKTNVVATEAGAITQHISTYQITYKDKLITFVDTPGHEAFTAMRARGSQLADFIILVVSAVEGPKPQTVEVIERAKLSKTPVIVAVNKIDLPNSDFDKVKQEVSNFGLVPEEWGGNTPFIPISAKNGDNLDQLLDTVLLHAEFAELKGEVDCPGRAVVVESHADPKIGTVVTAIISRGELKVGDFIQAETIYGKIRKLNTTEGQNLQVASLTEPVEILGLPDMVMVGEKISVFPSLKEAQLASEEEQMRRNQKRVNINNQSAVSEDGSINLVLVADVAGSLEALKESILKIPQESAKIVIKQESIGQVTESDIEYANLTQSTVLAFHTTLHTGANQALKQSKVNLVQSDIIYELLEWVESEVLKNVKHEIKVVNLGEAKVLAMFKSEKSQIQVFGAEVIDGKILANKNLQLVRKDEVLGKLEIVELQRNKVKANEVNINQQFGVSVTGKVKVQVGDTIQSIDEIVVK